MRGIGDLWWWSEMGLCWSVCWVVLRGCFGIWVDNGLMVKAIFLSWLLFLLLLLAFAEQRNFKLWYETRSELIVFFFLGFWRLLRIQVKWRRGLWCAHGHRALEVTQISSPNFHFFSIVFHSAPSYVTYNKTPSYSCLSSHQTAPRQPF